MLFRPILTLAFACMTFAGRSPMKGPTTAFDLILDIKRIDDSLQALCADLQSYNSSKPIYGPITADISHIHLSNRKACLDARFAEPFNSTYSTSIVEYIIKTVGVNIPAAAQVLNSKKSDFRGQEHLILGVTKMLKQDHDSLSEALMSKITADQDRANLVVKKINNALQSSIDAYSP